MARKVQRILWPHRGGDATCPVCHLALLFRDPVYVGIAATPVHEWCAWVEKRRAQANPPEEAQA